MLVFFANNIQPHRDRPEAGKELHFIVIVLVPREWDKVRTSKGFDGLNGEHVQGSPVGFKPGEGGCGTRG